MPQPCISPWKESVEYFQTVQAEFEKTEDRSRFISVLGHVTAYLGLHHYYVLQFGKASEYLEEAIRLLTLGQSWVEKAQAQVMLGALICNLGHLQESAALNEQSREVFREAGEDWWYLLATTNLARVLITLGRVQEGEALFHEGLPLLKPGDLRVGLPLRSAYAYVLKFNHDFARAELMLQENLQMSDQLGNNSLTARTYLDLGRVALASQRVEQAIEYIQKGINIICDSVDTPDLYFYRLYLGKCFAARPDLPAARAQFRQVIKDGQAQDKFHMVCWGLACIARTYIVEGQIEKALEISLLLKHYPSEIKRIRDDVIGLQADLKAALPEGQLERALQQVDGDISPEQARAGVLAYVREHETV